MDVIQSGYAAERSPFLGSRVPNYLRALCKVLPTVKKSLFRQLIKLAVLDFEGKSVTSEMYHSIKGENGSDIDTVYGALYCLLRHALSLPESSLKQEIFKDDLRELKLPVDYIEDLANVVYGPRCLPIADHFIYNIPHLPKLEKFRWRVDVTISTSTLNKILEPTIVMEVQLSDGQRITFEVFTSQFHQLRFAVATLLKEMGILEMKNVLKL